MNAEEILIILGGKARLYAMIGATNFVSGDDFLSFEFKGSRKTNFVRISIDDLDLYKMEFMKHANFDFKPFETVNHIYCDQLSNTFQVTTGLALRLF